MTSVGAPVVAITGAAGFIGRNLCGHLRRRGWLVRAFVRNPSSYPFTESGIQVHACDLPGTLDEDALGSAQAVVHCAYVTRHMDLEQARRVNDAGTRRVVEAARRGGLARLVFLSSQSAHAEALSYYGRSKFALEALFSGERDTVVRPGLVLGPGDAGLFARMCETVRRSRIIPLFGGGRQPLQTVHVDDLCAAITSILERGLPGLFTVAEPTPVGMRAFLELVAGRMGSRPLMVPLPMAPALFTLRSLEALRIPLPVSSENLLGLKQMRAVDTRRDLAALGISARTARESIEAIFRA